MRRIEFANQLLDDGHWPQTYENQVWLLAWMAAENTEAPNNPMATTEPDPRGIDFNTAHVKAYDTPDLGIEETIETLENGLYGPIIAQLVLGASAELGAQTVVQSRWGTGRNILSLIETVEGNFEDYANILIGGSVPSEPPVVPPAPLVPCNQLKGTPPHGLPLLRLTEPFTTGPVVARLQEELYGHGHAPRNSQHADGSWDGIFGPGTDLAVRSFQADSGLVADGIVGIQTYCCLGVR